jgi:hypothetical protein
MPCAARGAPGSVFSWTAVALLNAGEDHRRMMVAAEKVSDEQASNNPGRGAST